MSMYPFGTAAQRRACVLAYDLCHKHKGEEHIYDIVIAAVSLVVKLTHAEMREVMSNVLETVFAEGIITKAQMQDSLITLNDEAIRDRFTE